MPGIKKPLPFIRKKETSNQEGDFVLQKESGIPASLIPKEIQETQEVTSKETEKSEPKVEPKTEAETPIKPAPSQPSTPVATGESREPKSPELTRIENILEQDMQEVFQSLDPATQMRFKQEGEITAGKIEQILTQVKIKVKEIIDLIRNWLLIIPGVNKYFIEQETKIKVDKIMTLRK